MHLTKLEIQGFKTFAQKTTLTFLPPKNGVAPVTAIVGPNGSGKSNSADAIRWVLGEQSLKLLRGKASEDVIFSGSDQRTRAGFAEVSISFDNHDRSMPVEFTEVTITRRLYRDGASEYLVNGATSRLSDIQLLLAQANIGQRSYAVVGQGMIDHILVSSPEERKTFFDDATGVKPLQMKRHEAMLKLKRTYENLAEVEMLLTEIEPRLKSLKRQVARLSEREAVERTLQELERRYYGSLWWKLSDQLTEARTRHDALEASAKAEREGMKTLEAQVSAYEAEERNEAPDSKLLTLQKQYQDAQKKRGSLRDEAFDVQKKIELEKVRAQSNWAPLPLGKIIEEIDGLVGEQHALLKRIKEVKSLEELSALEKLIDASLERSTSLSRRLQRPSPEDVKTDPALLERLAAIAVEQKRAEEDLVSFEQQIEKSAAEEKKVRVEVIEAQKELREKQRAVHEMENKKNSVAIELARFEERRENLGREMDESLKENAAEIRVTRHEGTEEDASLLPEIQRLRYKKELIGGIDPEIVKEYEETDARFLFLSTQVKDLRDAINATEKVVDELDEDIREQSEKAFRKINVEFQRYFKVLFGGGSCSLVQLTKEDLAEPVPEGEPAETLAEEMQHHEEDTSIESLKLRIKEREDRVIGIEIQATPPGKKMKSLNLLSGGERALTSIALISAIMAVNPSPFVVLDEVDAALDEANTIRFAAIVEELAKLSQFVIITHNRATMEKADILYGVTMGSDGVSNLLSVKLAEVTQGGTARR